MIVRCSCCAKQIVNYGVAHYDKRVTTSAGAVKDVGNKMICGFCAEELDENGLFPEERNQIN